MKSTSSLSLFVVLLVLAAGFIVLSGQSLPPVVASHFALGGNADGFMPRNAYLGLMLLITVGVPLLLALGHNLLRFVPVNLVSLPNRNYWLSPERTAETFAFLRNHGIYLSALTAAFLCFVHWLVVQANKVQPPLLSTSWFVTGLVLFLLSVAAWTGVLFLHFRRSP